MSWSFTDTTYRSAVEVNDAMIRVYKYMMFAMIVSGVVAAAVASSPPLMAILFGTWFKWVVLFAPLIAVFAFIPMMKANPPSPFPQLMLYGFAALMGLSLAAFLSFFTTASIVSAFMGTTILFGTMSIYGYFTKRSLESLGQFLFIGLIAIILASIVNIFIGSSTATMVISALAIIIFLGLTAYDTQQIRQMVSVETTEMVEVMGALSLYINFVNIFTSLLQLFGQRND